MAIPQARPGEAVDVRPLGSALASVQTSTLLKTENIEVVGLVMAKGKEIGEHKAAGKMTVP